MSYAIVTQLQPKSNIVWTSEYKSDYVIGDDAWEITNLKFKLHINSTFGFWLVNRFVKSKIVKSFRATTCQIFLFTFSKKLNQKCSVTNSRLTVKSTGDLFVQRSFFISNRKTTTILVAIILGLKNKIQWESVRCEFKEVSNLQWSREVYRCRSHNVAKTFMKLQL